MVSGSQAMRDRPTMIDGILIGVSWLNKYLMGSHFSVHWMAGFVSGIIGF
jgi:hypothetical protein